MNWRDLKYFAAYIIPLLVFLGLENKGIWTYSSFIFAFVIIPLVEPIFSSSEENFTSEEKENRLSTIFFDFLLLLNIPIIYGLLIYLGFELRGFLYQPYELVGIVLSFGVMLGTGINVAHELGHRKSKFYQFLGKILLLPCLYNHFFIEHNRGHHKFVATDEDPASAKKGEILYSFWLRSVVNSYLNAWKWESQRLKGKKFSLRNEMIIYSLFQLLYIGTIYIFLGYKIMIIFLLIAVVSFLLLETINYIEHYGLRRIKLENGMYERVLPIHSWNSNHYLGRIILYELTRHSDHHFLAHKEYQILEHHKNSPQLPYGYPSCMLMSFLPILWFKVMDRKLLDI